MNRRSLTTRSVRGRQHTDPAPQGKAFFYEVGLPFPSPSMLYTVGRLRAMVRAIAATDSPDSFRLRIVLACNGVTFTRLPFFEPPHRFPFALATA